MTAPDRRKQYLYEMRWRMARAAGIDTSPRPAAASRENVRRLHDLGCSYSAIETASGMSDSGLVHLVAGDYDTMQRRYATVLEHLTLTDVIAGALDSQYLPRWPAARRVHALMAIGHTHASISAHLRPGLTSHNVVGSTAVGRHIRAAKWRDMDRVYRALQLTPGPSPLSRRRALAAGHRPPLAWDNIDEPDLTIALANPPEDNTLDEIAIALAVEGHTVSLNTDESRAVVRELTAREVSAEVIAKRIRVAERTVVRWRLEDRETAKAATATSDAQSKQFAA